MNRRELNISDKILYTNTPEDIILKSPMRIPPKELQDLVSLKGINPSECAYYDISKTENQGINYLDLIEKISYGNIGYTEEEENIKMGDFIDI
jgi:hypothetical protein